MIIVIVDGKQIISMYHHRKLLWRWYSHEYTTRALFDINFAFDLIHRTYPHAQCVFCA